MKKFTPKSPDPYILDDSDAALAKLGHINHILPEEGTAAPATTPEFVGQMFVDTTNAKVYVATGTASASDWTILN